MVPLNTFSNEILTPQGLILTQNVTFCPFKLACNDQEGEDTSKVEDKESSVIFKVEDLVKLVFLASNPRRRFLAPNKNPWPMPSDFTNLMQML